MTRKLIGFWVISAVAALIGSLVWAHFGRGIDYKKGGETSAMRFFVIASDAPASMRVGGPNRYLCDGTADDVQLQLAAGSGDRVVELSPGTFNLAATVELYDDTVLRGAGRGATVMLLNSGVDNPNLSNEDHTDGNSDIVVEGIMFDGNRDNNTPNDFTLKDTPGNTGCVYFRKVTNLRIVGCGVKDPAPSGICASGCSDVIIESNVIEDSNDDAIAINNLSTRCVVANNIVKEVGQSNSYGGPAGIEIQDESSYVTVANNVLVGTATVGDSSPKGIAINAHATYNAPHDITVNANSITNFGSGIETWHATAADTQWPYNISITNNTISCLDKGGSGLYFVKVRRASVTGNAIYKNYSSAALIGLRFNEAEDVVVSKNIFYVLSGGNHSNDTAVYVCDGISSRDATIKRLRIENNVFTNWDSMVFKMYDATGQTTTLTDVVIQDNTMDSPDVATGYTFGWYDADPGGTYLRCVWRRNTQGEAVSAEHYIDSTSNWGDAGWEAELYEVTVPDSEDANHGTLTIQPNKEHVLLTCADEHGGTITLGETNARKGFVMTITVVGSYHCDFADSSGVCELEGGVAFAANPLDSITFVYNGSAWVEQGRSDNTP